MKNNFTIFFAFLMCSSLTYGSERTVSRGHPFAKYLQYITDVENNNNDYTKKPDPNLNFLKTNEQSDIILLRLEEERDFGLLLLTEAAELKSLKNNEDSNLELKEMQETHKKRIEDLESGFQEENNKLDALKNINTAAQVAAQTAQAEQKKLRQGNLYILAGLAVTGATFYGARYTKRGQNMTQTAIDSVQNALSLLRKPFAGLFAAAAVTVPVVLNTASVQPTEV